MGTSGEPAKRIEIKMFCDPTSFDIIVSMIINRFNEENLMILKDEFAEFCKLEHNFNDGTFQNMICESDRLSSYIEKSTDRKKI